MRAARSQADDDLPRPEEIEVEFQDLYRHDEEQAYLTLMSQEIKSINFPCEENYTIRLCVRAAAAPSRAVQRLPRRPLRTQATQQPCEASTLPRTRRSPAERARDVPQSGHVPSRLFRADRLEPHPF